MGVLVRIGLAQINTTVGDLEGNTRLIQDAYSELCDLGAEIVLTPELAITGYPPQDLLFKKSFLADSSRSLESLETREVPLVVGTITPNQSSTGRPLHNSAVVLQRNQQMAVCHKVLLPTYDVFDEARYFEPGPTPEPVYISGVKVGITICEDLWTPDQLPNPFYACDPLTQLAEGGAKLILNLSASPFQLGKPSVRRKMLQNQSSRANLPIAYCNSVGGNDQLVFDGHSLLINPAGEYWQAKGFQEVNSCVTPDAVKTQQTTDEPDLEQLFQALAMGVRDYLGKCGFQSVVLGLSGGIDSALTACIAVEALGPENVTGVLMPSEFSSPHSIADAEELARALKIKTHTLPIHDAFVTLKNGLSDAFQGTEEDTTEENIQARLRGITLMALSNKFGSLLLTTGNKSELAVGYCTLYGDMCGGLAVISDVPKTLVYKLCHHINAVRGNWIPSSTITKPPSAELRPDQKDQDTLPPYDVLDSILQLYVEDNMSSPDIIAAGYPEETVRWIVKRVDLNEYKRAQAAPGIKVTGRAFGMGRRIPIAQRYLS